MRFFFALSLGPRLSLDAEYLSRNRTALIVRNVLAVLGYGLVVTPLQHDHPLLAGVLVVMAACHAWMIGVVFGGGKDGR